VLDGRSRRRSVRAQRGPGLRAGGRSALASACQRPSCVPTTKRVGAPQLAWARRFSVWRPCCRTAGPRRLQTPRLATVAAG